MFKTTLSGDTIKLVKSSKADIDTLYIQSHALPSNLDIDELLLSESMLYWSITIKEKDRFIGVVGVSTEMKVNQIFFKFMKDTERINHILKEMLSLLLDYLEYSKFKGAYEIKVKDPKHRVRKALELNGFKKTTSNSWLLEI